MRVVASAPPSVAPPNWIQLDTTRVSPHPPKQPSSPPDLLLELSLALPYEDYQRTVDALFAATGARGVVTPCGVLQGVGGWSEGQFPPPKGGSGGVSPRRPKRRLTPTPEHIAPPQPNPPPPPPTHTRSPFRPGPRRPPGPGGVPAALQAAGARAARFQAAGPPL